MSLFIFFFTCVNGVVYFLYFWSHASLYWRSFYQNGGKILLCCQGKKNKKEKKVAVFTLTLHFPEHHH